jgi:hypothetical protein
MGQQRGGSADDVELAQRLARSLAGIIEHAHNVLEGGGGSSATSRKISGHLGVDVDRTVLVGTDLPVWQHVSVQRGADAYLSERGDRDGWFGITSPHREHMDLMSLLQQQGRSGSETVSTPEYTSGATGPATKIDVIAFGLVCTHAPPGEPVVLAMHRNSRHGPPVISLSVLAADRRVASAAAERLQALIDEHDVIRGQVVSFGISENFGNALVTFLPRPQLSADDVILEPSVLPAIEHHLLATAEHSERLRRTGIHLKRGLLLHGPPGTGKTHTVRYLMSRLTDSTIIVLTGTSLQFIEDAAALARKLAPTVVVVEDVDLVGRDRSFSPNGNPLLFTLLDAMDGVAADADVTFILTTNRASELEQALIERPGRIDLAVEIPLPDAEAREKLLRLYAGRAEVTTDLGPAVAATQGTTASAMKELMRRCVLAAIESSPDPAAVPTVTNAVLGEVVQQFVADARALSQALGGAGEASGFSGADGSDGTAGGPPRFVAVPGRAPMRHRRIYVDPQ